MSTQEHRDHEQRIVDALEEHREDLEEVANSDTAFADRAEAALEWIEEHSDDAESEADADA